ncbi:MAG: hypothetical protein H6581_29140 [Bacteroidia bacterium]|nr:hypothetical protein [Bacteroidia bacterium]
MKINRLILLAGVLLIVFAGCKKNEPDPWVPADPVKGCTDPNSLTYDPGANEDDGSCEYPDNYFPTAPGNYWNLEGSVEIPLLGTVAFNANFNMIKDTTMNGVHYVVSVEETGNPDFGSQSSRFAYRKDNLGNVYRVDVGAADLTETLFMSYPLTLNNSWYDTPNEDHYLCTVNSISNQSVSAGVFTNVVEILYTDLANGNNFSVFFAKDAGIVKVAVEFEAGPLGTLNIEPELTAYQLNDATIK